MKITGQVTNAGLHSDSMRGNSLQVELSGSAAGDGEYSPVRTCVISVPDVAANRRAFHVGRRVEITVKPL